jgi:prepilin-type N-terminal cleavage/methylation domain-containing protein
MQSAFSLVELSLSIAIIGISCAIVLPHWSNSIQNYQLSLAARRVAADIAWAQSIANSGSASVTISFDSIGSTYQILSNADPDHPAQTYTVNLAADPYHVTLSSVNFASATQLSFNGYGVPTNAGTIVLAAGGVQKTIGVDGVTGNVSIQ